MAVAESEVKTRRTPISKRWWIWALVGIILFVWIKACTADKLDELEEQHQASEWRVLVYQDAEHRMLGQDLPHPTRKDWH